MSTENTELNPHRDDMFDGIDGLVFREPVIFDKGSPAREGFNFPAEEGIPPLEAEDLYPKELIRLKIDGMPEVSEPEVVRHYTRMSQWNFCIDSNMYPLGSCTMKYNPKVNDVMASFDSFASLHPMVEEEAAQGALEIMHNLGSYLAEITGLPGVSLQPAAGANGELAGLMVIRGKLKKTGNPRKKVLLPDSAHGTNPASATLCGYDVEELPSGADGLVDLEKLRAAMTEDVACLMITNPNTLGLFEEKIIEISRIVHEKGGYVYCDGANMNALLGICRVGALGIDVVHINLHKTFSTPHGGGGPGAGPICVTAELEPYLPAPVVRKNETGTFSLDWKRKDSLGKMHSFYGNFGVLIRAYSYIRSMGPDGLKRVAETAVVNANYIRKKLEPYYHLPYGGKPRLHEVVFSDKNQLEHGVSTLDIAKALMDYGFHPPTVYFPLIVKGALMIEPTETESRETLDKFIAAMIRIAVDAKADPDRIKSAPHKTYLQRLDETLAARKPDLRWRSAGTNEK